MTISSNLNRHLSQQSLVPLFGDVGFSIGSIFRYLTRHQQVPAHVEYDDDDDYSEPRKVLFVDSNVDCNSRTYMIMKIYAAVNVVIWPVGIPLGLMLWLGALAKYLDPPGMTEAQAIAEREIDTRVKRSAIAFMALYYRPRYW